MAEELFMIGLVVQDMEKSREFYRRLGLAIPDGSTGQTPVGITMRSEYTFFLTPNAIRSERTATGEALENLRVFFELYLKNESAVRAKYAELVGYGYQSYRAPFYATVGIPTPTEMCFALVNDPDGNSILLSGDREQQGAAKED